MVVCGGTTRGPGRKAQSHAFSPLDRPPRPIEFQQIEAGFRAPKLSFRTIPTQFSAKRMQGGTSNTANRTQVWADRGHESDMISAEDDSALLSDRRRFRRMQRAVRHLTPPPPGGYGPDRHHA